MTVKDITEAVGRGESTIRRWIDKAPFHNPELVLRKIREGSPENPADFDLDETIEIIRHGMGANAADLFRMSANNKMPAIIDDRMGEFLSSMMKMMIVLADKVASIQTGQLQIEAPKQDYYSLVGFCSFRHIKTNFSELSGHGMKLRQMTLDAGRELCKVPDERWGYVNSYPIEILEEYFTP